MPSGSILRLEQKTDISAAHMTENQQQAEIIQLYQDTSEELRRLLERKLGNPQEAEEIAHDAYLKLCRIEQKEEIRDLRKYLFTMSVRLALNVLRRRKTERNFKNKENSGLEVDYISAYRILLAELKLDAVKDALSELPEKTRYIFLLHRFEGMTYPEISSKLGLSSKTIEYHMGRALARVMVAVEDFTGKDEL